MAKVGSVYNKAHTHVSIRLRHTARYRNKVLVRIKFSTSIPTSIYKQLTPGQADSLSRTQQFIIWSCIISYYQVRVLVDNSTGTIFKYNWEIGKSC